MLQAHGFPVFDADEAARKATLPGTPGLDAIVAAFGPDLLLPDGSLDRASLARRIFSDPAARTLVERIVHPLVDAAAAEWLAGRAAEGHTVCIYEAPLIFETGRHAWLDGVVAVLADVETRIRRVVERDGVTPEAVRARLAAQIDDAERRRLARWVIVNDGSLADLARQVGILAGQLYRPDPGPPPDRLAFGSL